MRSTEGADESEAWGEWAREIFWFRKAKKLLVHILKSSNAALFAGL